MFGLLCGRAHPMSNCMHYAWATQRGPPQCPRFEPHCVLEFEINLLLKIYVIKKRLLRLTLNLVFRTAVPYFGGRKLQPLHMC